MPRSPGRARRNEADGRSGEGAQRVAPRGATRPARANDGGAVPQCRRSTRRPRSLRQSECALHGDRRAGLQQVSAADRQHAEIDHGADQGSTRRPEGHHAEAGVAEHGRRDARNRRGRQCLRRPLLHPRLRCAQRHLPRRHPRCRRQRPRKLLHRAGRNPARPGSSFAGRGVTGGAIKSSPSRPPPPAISTTWIRPSAPT